ncbi:MAG: bifunctional diguanylate cyclase/phosphodiesterase, partial [Pseudomonadota bacterium]|nr:bifunctional diguanylate cyclase/phosphodiesterase [Pseudomonadota bacterium]
FKDVNDTMGHNIGDAILRGVGKRLASALPDTAVVARTGEDEYAITVPMVTSITNAKEIGERIQNVIRNEPFKVFNENFQIRCSIGVATYPDDASDPEQVLKNADIALNRAKEDGRDTIREYVEDFDRAVQLRFQMLRDLRDALEEEQLTLHFQPQLDLKTGEVIGAEALLRWWRPDDSEQGGTYISPGLFVPIAEQSGLIVPIGEFVLRNACRTAKTWHDKGHNVRIAVNVSGAQFHQSDVVALTKEVLEETGIPPKYLELEVTESVFMDDVEFTIETLMKLNQIGVELAIDDFGTGYSSLSYLRQFPIDRLKIDQSFIRNALQDEDDAAITKTIISLGHSLNLKVIAEGVEDYEHEEFLLREGCDEVQGYRYSRPVPADQFMEFLETYNGDLEHFKKQA